MSSAAWGFLGAILGSILTLIGGMASPIIVHRTQSKSEQRKIRQHKFEEMITTAFDHGHWLEEQRNVRVFGEEDRRTPSPFPKLYAMVSMHFPSLLDRVEALRKASAKYEGWMFARKKDRLEGNMSKLGDGSSEAYQEYFSVFAAFIGAANAYAQANLH